MNVPEENKERPSETAFEVTDDKSDIESSIRSLEAVKEELNFIQLGIKHHINFILPTMPGDHESEINRLSEKRSMTKMQIKAVNEEIEKLREELMQRTVEVEDEAR